MIPGSNILNMALTVISPTTVTYFQSTGRTKNSIGQYVTNYAVGSQLRGSLQPVSRRMYEQYGLDFQKTYYLFYVSKNLIDVNRDVSGDQITFNASRFECESADGSWFAIDGWVGMLLVLISGPAP